MERRAAGPDRRYRDDPARAMRDARVEPDPWQEGVLRCDAGRLLLLCSRQSGKSLTAAALSLVTAITRPGSLTLLLSPSLRQSGELFRDKVLRLWSRLPRRPAVESETALSLTLANGSRIVSLPGDEETIRGFSGVSLLVIDEAARVPDELYKSVRPMLAVSGGRLVALSTPYGRRGWFHDEWQGEGDWHRVRVAATDCPRISAEFLAEERRAMGEGWFRQEYLCEFTDAASDPLFPPEWLDRAEGLARGLAGRRRQALAAGCDPGEGVANTALCAVDQHGVVALESARTPDTSQIVGRAIDFMKRHCVPPERMAFDRGGGGRQIADLLRSRGYAVRTVGFGEAVSAEARRGRAPLARRVGQAEERYAYVNRRAQLYGALRQLLDPASGRGFAIPAESGLRRQLSPIPLLWDAEGRLRLPPKNRRSANSTERTLVELVGHSPDEADALCLGIFAMQHQAARPVAGAIL